MIQLLFSVIFSQMALIMLLMFKTPLRKLVIFSLDRVKRGRGPLVVKSVGATVFVITIYTVYSVQEIRSRNKESLNPTDQVLLADQVLQASLMGFILFLALMIDRQHHYIREIRSLRKSAEVGKKQTRVLDDTKNALKEEASTYREKISASESKLNAKIQELKAAEANAESLKKQSEGLLLEYDRLLEENQSLRSQLQSIDQSHSDGKKNS